MSTSFHLQKKKAGNDILVQRVLAELTSHTGLLVASERHIGVQRVDAVDPHRACLQLVRELDPARHVAGEHGRGEAVQRVVRLPQRILVVFELDDDGDGPEYLLLDDAHVWMGVGENGRLDPVALISVALAAEVHGRAFFLARLDILHDTLFFETVSSLCSTKPEGRDVRRIGPERLGAPGTSHVQKDRQA